jgi:hypothetical protein
MRRINESILLRGDILLTTSPAFDSRTTRYWTKSDISHAMLYVAAGSVMDSTKEGVHARNIQKLFYEDECAIHALRLTTPISAGAMDAAIKYVRNATGTTYSAAEAVRSISSPKSDGSKKQFCSRLVARAFDSVGVRLVDNPNFCTPEQLKQSPLLQTLDAASISVSPEELEAVRLHRDGAAGMRHVTNQFLNSVRLFAPEAESIQDAVDAAVKDAGLDERISDALKASGYLDYWKTEACEFAWRYDITKMVAVQNHFQVVDQLRSYCETTLRDDADGVFIHWLDSLQVTGQLAVQHERKSLTLLNELDMNLFELHTKRVLTARTWLHWQDRVRS